MKDLKAYITKDVMKRIKHNKGNWWLCTSSGDTSKEWFWVPREVPNAIRLTFGLYPWDWFIITERDIKAHLKEIESDGWGKYFKLPDFKNEKELITYVTDIFEKDDGPGLGREYDHESLPKLFK